MNTKEHYEHHLANFYSWMVGDLETKSNEFLRLLNSYGIIAKNTKTAIDLGAGHGIQSIALKDLGFDVLAVDFNAQLLSELKTNPKGSGIQTILADITDISKFENLNPELIVCCGDTITHLESKKHIEKLISDSSKILKNNGHLIFTFRDYTNELNDQQRFIPVKSTDNRILTCILEYGSTKVKVTDLLHEKIDGEWKQKTSSYKKVRIAPKEVVQMLLDQGMTIKLNKQMNRMETIIAKKTAYSNSTV